MAGTSERQAACGRHGGCLPLVMWTATTVADCRFHKLSLRPCALWPMPPGSAVMSDLFFFFVFFPLDLPPLPLPRRFPLRVGVCSHVSSPVLWLPMPAATLGTGLISYWLISYWLHTDRFGGLGLLNRTELTPFSPEASLRVWTCVRLSTGLRRVTLALCPGVHPSPSSSPSCM